MLQKCPVGATKKCCSISMTASVVSGLSLAPRHSRKKRAAASRSSIMAMWIPRQPLDPMPNGVKANFCSGDCGCRNRFSSNLMVR